MIERDFINQKTKEFYIKKYIENKLNRVGVSQIRLKKIPLGEKIIVHTSRPSLIVGSKGANIKDLTKALKRDFKLENPQIEINEVKNIFLDADIVAERIAGSLERFGSARFKGVGHKTMANVINSGALGVEIIISGKIPGARAKNWRFYQGYLKKCGDVSISGVRSAQKTALLKSGIIGIKVKIMPPGLVLPDSIEVMKEPVTVVEEVSEAETAEKPEQETAGSKPTKETKKSETVKEAEKPVAEEASSKETVEAPIEKPEALQEDASKVADEEIKSEKAQPQDAPLEDSPADAKLADTNPENSQPKAAEKAQESTEDTT